MEEKQLSKKYQYWMFFNVKFVLKLSSVLEPLSPADVEGTQASLVHPETCLDYSYQFGNQVISFPTEITY